ncbi:uncharacterized protein BJ212DRAFT_1296436 [Suillus subaureus]|uniref:Uncharacterized protein n=1 Tax=Suillus subaureus TaxID=48587 RepID=A0A9P7JI94_9AGAM|nr:uncharacterized protein BJ212DRAFT_1296436 [Suillus subaureus]KAG1823920.1 hypothetical protein BJ212DRAFT_1296436 [Suillus subaureus]
MDTPNWIFPDHDTYNHCVTPNDAEEWQASQTPQKSCLCDTMQPAPSLPFGYAHPPAYIQPTAQPVPWNLQDKLVSTPVPSIGTHHVTPPATFSPGTIFGAEVTPNMTPAQKSQDHSVMSTDSPVPSKTTKQARGKMASETKAKRGGKGSKSGEGSHCITGTSDDKVLKLTETMLGEADLKLETAVSGDAAVKPESKHGLTDEEKVTAVKYITSVKVWYKFWLNQGMLAHKTLENHVTYAQVRNFWWDQAWEKYKQVKEMEEHTGGGDGDDDRIATESGDEEEAEVLNLETKDNTMALDGMKHRKSTTKAKFAHHMLEALKETEMFRLIDEVAWNDATVIHTHDINSSDSISISDDETTPLKK